MLDELAPRGRAEVASQLALILEAAPQGVLVSDDAGCIVLVNAELVRMFGHPRDALLGRQVELLIPERYRSAHTVMRERYLTHASPRAMGAARELFGLRADGSEFPIEVGLSAVRAREGLLAIATMTDITAHRRAHSALRNVVDAAPYGLMMVDADGTVTMANSRACDTFGYTTTELVGSSLEQLIPARYRHKHAELRERYTARPELRSMGAGRDLTGLHRDGTEFPVEIGLSPVDWNGRPMVLAAVIDITTRKSLELELRQANENLEEFTYVASHDLKSPLRGIADLVDWLGEDLADTDNPAVRKNLSRVQLRVQRMEKIIDDLLRYARAGRASTEISLVDPRALIEEVLELQPRPAGFEVAVSVRAQPFQTARVPLETCLRNLISNAFKHHDREQGRIAIDVCEADAYCRFNVQDDGPGIPQDAQSRIFKLFQTVSAAERNGGGIGLALTKRLVEGHGGRIAVVSSNQSRGTTFEVLWPRFQRRSLHEQL